MWWQELNDPPTPEQLRSWEEIRECGYWQYLLYGIRDMTVLGLIPWMLNRLLIE